MRVRVLTGSAALAAVCLLSGCHHRAAVSAVVPPPVAPAAAGPVMVSVPPPTHHSTDMPEAVAMESTIPVVKPVSPPRRIFHRTPRPAPATTTSAATSESAVSVAAASASSVNLGQLTSSTDDPAATRDGAANALRHERDRLAGVSPSLQATHVSEIEQAKRFLKSASDSWNAADYSATIALATKARVLLDDLLK